MKTLLFRGIVWIGILLLLADFLRVFGYFENIIKNDADFALLFLIGLIVGLIGFLGESYQKKTYTKLQGKMKKKMILNLWTAIGCSFLLVIALLHQIFK